MFNVSKYYGAVVGLTKFWKSGADLRNYVTTLDAVP